MNQTSLLSTAVRSLSSVSGLLQPGLPFTNFPQSECDVLTETSLPAKDCPCVVDFPFLAEPHESGMKDLRVEFCATSIRVVSAVSERIRRRAACAHSPGKGLLASILWVRWSGRADWQEVTAASVGAGASILHFPSTHLILVTALLEMPLIQRECRSWLRSLPGLTPAWLLAAALPPSASHAPLVEIGRHSCLYNASAVSLFKQAIIDSISDPTKPVLTSPEFNVAVENSKVTIGQLTKKCPRITFVVRARLGIHSCFLR